jgi:hypothetical protein
LDEFVECVSERKPETGGGEEESSMMSRAFSLRSNGLVEKRKMCTSIADRVRSMVPY